MGGAFPSDSMIHQINHIKKRRDAQLPPGLLHICHPNTIIPNLCLHKAVDSPILIAAKILLYSCFSIVDY